VALDQAGIASFGQLQQRAQDSGTTLAPVAAVPVVYQVLDLLSVSTAGPPPGWRIGTASCSPVSATGDTVQVSAPGGV
jgi:hypothetical protein